MILSMIHFEVKQMIDSFKLEGVWKRKATQMSNDATKLMAHVTAELDEQARKQVKRAISHFKVDIVQNQQFSKDFQRESEDWFADIIEAARRVAKRYKLVRFVRHLYRARYLSLMNMPLKVYALIKLMCRC